MSHNKTNFFFLWRCSPRQAMASSFLRLLDHTQWRTTACTTPLDEWSARRRDLYLTTLTTDRHPCPWRDSNPQSQQMSGRKPTPWTARPEGTAIKPTRCTNFSNLFLEWQLRAASWCSILILLTAVGKPVWHIPLLCVQWKTPDEGQRNCLKHVEFQSKNKFEKLVHLAGVIIRNLSRCTVIWTSNKINYVFIINRSKRTWTHLNFLLRLMHNTVKYSIWRKHRVL